MTGARKRTSESFNFTGDRAKPSQSFKESTQINSTINPSTPSNYGQNTRERIMSQSNNYPGSFDNPHPKSHNGPFNAKCLFLENAPSLMKKISIFLKENNMKFVEH